MRDVMISATAPIDSLTVKPKGNLEQKTEPIYGGYSNPRGEISLFGENLVYRVNSKNQTVRERPGLNFEAQARYDAVPPGETFEYCSRQFVRLTNEQIIEICATGAFRETPRV
jgi:hypothetical protein